MNNAWMEHFIERFGDEAGRTRQLFAQFLVRDHPIKEEIFSRIDNMSDREVEDRANRFLSGEIRSPDPIFIENHTLSSISKED